MQKISYKFSMLSFWIVLFSLCGIQGKAFPGRYKRNYEANYHYIPFEEGIVRLPTGYSPENFPNYQDYINGYAQINGYDWPVYYHQPVPSQSIRDPFSNVNGHHKMKAKHTWHFIDQNHNPLADYMDGRHKFESDIEVPNVIEAHVNKEVMDENEVKHDVPLAVQALRPISYEYDKNSVQTVSSTKHRGVHEPGNKMSNLDLLTDKQKSSASYEPVKISPVVYESFGHPVEMDFLAKKQKQTASYDMYEPSKEKTIKNFQSISSNEFELPVLVDTLGKKDKPVMVEPPNYIYEPVKKKPLVKEKAVAPYDALDNPFGFNSLNKMEHDHEIPIVVEALTRKEKPTLHMEGENETPVVEEALVGKHPHVYENEKTNAKIKEKPVVKEKAVAPYDALNNPIGFNSLNKIDHVHEIPLVVEALTRKEKPTLYMENEHETPIVLEELVSKHPPVYETEKTNTKENEILPKDLFHPNREYILTKEVLKNFDIPVVEALSFEQEIESNETPNQDGISSFDKSQGFKEPEMDSFEAEENGSAMDLDESHFSRSFPPVNSNIFSMLTNIKKQERQKFKSCVTPKNETGNCLPFQLCSVSNTISNVDELLRNVCIIDEVFIGVCCPEFPVETVRVDWEQLKPDTDMQNEENSSQISKDCGRLPPMVTDRNPWPWMALLIARTSDKIFCGGALIAEQYVLTAAHCTIRIPRNQILVRLGRSSLENRPEPDFEVIEIKRHAGYNRRTMQNDIALLKLSRRVQFGDFRRTVCLAKDEEGIESLVSKSASLLRWKETTGEIKDVESLSVISNQDCQNKMRTAIADSIICTEPRTDETMCNVDSGAPLIISKDDKFEVIGILTWNRNDCDERFPTVFTRVSSYHRWIEKLSS